jgi:hypothetical protein
MSSRSLTIIIVSAAAVFCSAAGSFAQTIDAVAGSDQEYIKANTDMRSYEIISTERHDEYMAYYNSIRERILKRLKRNYSHDYDDGDVHLFFVLDGKGRLFRMDVDLSGSTRNMALVDIALSSLKQASPFGPPPEGLDLKRIPFGLIITFKKDR